MVRLGRRRHARALVAGEPAWPVRAVVELRRVFEVYKREEIPFLQVMARRDNPIPNWEMAIRAHEWIEESLSEEQLAAKES